MDIINIHSDAFKSYGMVISHEQVSLEGRKSLMDYFEKETSAPETGNIYVADALPIHDLAVSKDVAKIVPYEQIQFGYCHGHNTKVNALEWHACEEVMLSVTDCVLFLGLYSELTRIEGKLTYETDRLTAVELKQGDMIRLDPKVLHFAPVKVTEAPFKTMIVLEKGTNTPLKVPMKNHLFLTNKWLIAHPDRQDLINQGAHPGVVGVNYDWEAWPTD